MTHRLICSVYKSSKKAGMFLYVDKKAGLEAIPEALNQVFGKPVHVMDLLLDASKTLAKISGEELLAAIQDKGFYLQMPDVEESLLVEHRKGLGLDPVVNKNSYS